MPQDPRQKTAPTQPFPGGEAFLPERAGRRLRTEVSGQAAPAAPKGPAKIRFAVIGLNHGHINGWASKRNIYGIVTHVDGVPRPRIEGKTL